MPAGFLTYWKQSFDSKEVNMKARNGPIVYIASAYSGDPQGNTEKTKRYSLFAVRQGAVPINPILNLTGVLSEEKERETAMGIDLRLLHKADEVWAFGVPTQGMLREIDEALERDIPVRLFTEEESYGVYGEM